MANKKISDLSQNQPHDDYLLEAAEAGVDNYKIKMVDLKGYTQPTPPEVVQAIDQQLGNSDWQTGGTTGIHGIEVGTLQAITDIEFPNADIRADAVTPNKAIVTFTDTKLTPTEVRQSLESLTGPSQLSYNNLKDTPAEITGKEIIDKINTDPSASIIDAAHVAHVTKLTHEVIDITADLTMNLANHEQYDERILSLKKGGSSPQTIRLPAIADIPDDFFLTFVNSRGSASAVVDITPSSGDTIAGARYYRIKYPDAVAIAHPKTSTDWLVTSRVSRELDGGDISG